MKLVTHLIFNGKCEEAFRFYEFLLGGKILLMLKHQDAPTSEPVPAEWRAKILHATLAVNGQELAGADAPAEHYKQPQGFSVLLSIDELAEAERIFNALAENGTVQMPLQETFWALRFGALTDRFGTPWEINCHKVAV